MMLRLAPEQFGATHLLTGPPDAPPTIPRAVGDNVDATQVLFGTLSLWIAYVACT